MILEAFLAWCETARTQDRIVAARTLVSAWKQPDLDAEIRRELRSAMTCLLDDPSPKVRLELAKGLAETDDAPRDIVLSLAHDQPEIAFTVISRSAVLTDGDLIDLLIRGDDAMRAILASRPHVSVILSAALAEAGDETEIEILLENPGACINRTSLKRVSERLGDCAAIRALLLDREDLPAEARHVLTEKVSQALASCSLVLATVGERRLERVKREACQSATVLLVSEISEQGRAGFIDHLRETGTLTPAFLMHALCSGKVDFFAAAIVNLSGLSDSRVASLIGDGRQHAIKALYEAAGLSPDISDVFVQATLVWRDNMRQSGHHDGIHARLNARLASQGLRRGAVAELLDMVERLDIVNRRQALRLAASGSALVAA